MEGQNNATSLRTKSSIILFSGIPGAGKSSLIERLVPIAVAANFQVIKISFDIIERLIASMQQENLSFRIESINDRICTLMKDTPVLNPLTEVDLLNSIAIDPNVSQHQNYDYDQLIWKDSRSKTFMIVEKIMQSSISQKPFILILDDNFLLNSMRKPYYRLAGEFQLGFCEVSVTASLETCLERNSKRKDEFRVPDQIIKNAFEKSECSQYIKHVITFDNNKDITAHLDNLMNDIIRVTNEIPVIFVDEEEEKVKKLEAHKINKQNLVHQLDLGIRAVIGCLMGSKSEDSKYNFIQDVIKNEPSKNLEHLKKNGALLSSFKSLYLELVSLFNDYEQSFEKENQVSDKFISETEKIILNKFTKPFNKFQKSLNTGTENLLKSYIKATWEIWEQCITKENNVFNLEELVCMFAKEWPLLIFHFCKFDNV